MGKPVVSIANYAKNGSIRFLGHTGSITNIGDEVVRVNGVALNNGDSLKLDFVGENLVYDQEFQIEFEDQFPESRGIAVVSTTIHCK